MIADPSETACVRVSESFIATAWLAAFCVQVEPPSREYSTKKYAVLLAELEFDKVNVEVAEPPEQLPNACDTLTSIIGQTIVTAVAAV